MYIPEGYEPSRKVAIFSSVFLALGIIGAITVAVQDNRAMSKGVRYTVGHTTRFVFLWSSGRGVKYIYSFKGKKYEQTVTYGYDADVPGRYYVKFAETRPETAEIYLNKPVPWGVESPPEGWKQRPW